MAKVFLFDFDGTLVDTMEGFADIAASVIHEAHPDISLETARRLYIETSGVPFCQQIELICPGDPGNNDVVKKFEETKIEGFFEQKFENDVRQAIEGLRAAGNRVGVSSGNFPDLIKEFVKREKLEFDIVLGFEEEKGFEKGKPHFDFACQEFGIDKSDLVFVGDSLKDADKAYEYGIDFVGVCGLFSCSEFEDRHPGIRTIKNLKELLEL